jgi:multisubunit Na+/H+ antiporter MnhB subunit
MKHELEFSMRITIFAIALYYILEYVFICEISNGIGMSALVFVITAVILLFWFFGRKKLKCICNNK